MAGIAEIIGEQSVTRCFALMIGLCAALAPALARAQTNLDAGKSASQIFAGACIECHKSPHGLGKGKGVSAVADFLNEHYTTNHAQAAALAAYVLGGRGAEPVNGTMQGRGQKPAAERASTSTEERKPAKRQPKPAAKPEQAAKPDEGKSTNAKLQRPVHEEAKPKEHATRDVPQASRAAAGPRNRGNEPKISEPPQEPATVAHVPPPAPPEPTSGQEASPSRPGQAPAPAAATPPTDAASGEAGESEPVPRDNIPD